jgi:hypothetical protein
VLLPTGALATFLGEVSLVPELSLGNTRQTCFGTVGINMQ